MLYHQVQLVQDLCSEVVINLLIYFQILHAAISLQACVKAKVSCRMFRTGHWGVDRNY